MKNHRFLNEYLRETFGCKVYKLALESGCTCPNRDGTVGVGGCIFCPEGGSGDFAESLAGDLSDGEFDAAMERARAKVASKNPSGKYIAYFQSYTNTYGDTGRLLSLYKRVLLREDIVALSIGTRPDCMGPGVLSMLRELQTIKPVWVELGLQTVHERTARLINRGYELPVFEEAYRSLKEIGVTVVAHVILGLPGESLDDMRATVRYLANLSPRLDGIKLQLLHVLKGTALGNLYLEKGTTGGYEFDLDSYVSFIDELVSLLPRETVLHRLTGDGPKRDLLYPLWTGDKKRVLNAINKIK